MTKPQVTPHFAQKHFHIGILGSPDILLTPDFMTQALEAFCQLGFTVSLMASGTEAQQKALFEVAKRFESQCEVLEELPKNQSQIMQQSSVALFWGKPDLKTLQKCSKEGIVAIMPYSDSIKGVASFDAQKETGNAFLYEAGNFWAFFATTVRAFENFKFAYDWNNLKKKWKEAELV